MLDSISWDQFCEWQQFYSLEPFGEKRADLRAGVIASVIANVNRDRKSRPNPFKPTDFVLDFEGASASADRRKPMTSQRDWKAFKQGIRAASHAQTAQQRGSRTRAQSPPVNLGLDLGRLSP